MKDDLQWQDILLLHLGDIAQSLFRSHGTQLLESVELYLGGVLKWQGTLW